MTRTFSSGIRVEVDPSAAGEVRLTLPAVAENVAVVRQALTGMTEALGIGPGVLAARANFSLDRLSDAQLVSDAVAAHALGHAAMGALRVEVDDDERALDIRVGPLAANGGQRVVDESDLPGVGLLLEHLVDDVS